MNLWTWVNQTRQSELIVVLAEDVAALFGLTIALIAIGLSIFTGNPVFDACGSIGIGVLLIFVSVFLATKVKSLLLGESTDEETSASIKSFLQNRDEVDLVLNLITIQLGSDIMVAVKAKMSKADSIDQMIENINTCESELKKNNPAIKWIFFEPDIRD
jgi:divalent metal cation (Fe/Co/Zn/Cd) transporter